MKIKWLFIFLFGSLAVYFFHPQGDQPLAEFFSKGGRQAVDLRSIPDHSKVFILLGDKELEVEVVNTSESITQGLSGRESIGADGMLFILPERRVPTFWMKEMKFDLDMIWIDDYKVVDITTKVPKPEEDLNLRELPLYSPSQVVDMVLEVEKGKAEDWNVEVGNVVKTNR